MEAPKGLARLGLAFNGHPGRRRTAGVLWVCLLCCCRAAPEPAPEPPLTALRRGGIALRPVAPGPARAMTSYRPPPGPAASGRSAPGPEVPALLAPVAEVRLLATRLGRPPSVGVGCAPVGTGAGPEDRGPVQSCLGAPLPNPLDAALVTELVIAGRVVGVSLEETFLDASEESGESATAAACFHSLGTRLLAAYGPPGARREGRVQHAAGPFTIILELLPPVGGAAHVYLEVRSPQAGPVHDT